MWVLEKAKEMKEWTDTLWKQAKQRIPGEYHEFIVGITQHVSLGKSDEHYNNEQLKALGVFYNKQEKEYFMRLSLPYTSVDGRVAMARDEHLKQGKRLNIMPTVFDFDNKICQVTVHSEIRGQATGTVKIGGGRSKADLTHPIENAETSALGRALGFLGYGLLGTGIASAEEVQNAMEEQEKIRETHKKQKEPIPLSFTGSPARKQEEPPKSTNSKRPQTNGQISAWWEVGVPVDMKKGVELAGQPMYRIQLNTKKVIHVPYQHPALSMIKEACQGGAIIKFFVCDYQGSIVIAAREANAVQNVA